MPEKRHLGGKGRGEVLYDYKYDTLAFKIKDRNYKKSIEFQNFVVDIDDEDFITGIRIFDASKVFNVEKIVLRQIVHWKFKADVEDNVITITLNFVSKLRNKLIPLLSEKQKFTQQFTTPGDPKHPLSNSTVECPAAA